MPREKQTSCISKYPLTICTTTQSVIYLPSTDAKPRVISSSLEYCRGAKEEGEANRGSSEGHQACLNGRVVTEEGEANAVTFLLYGFDKYKAKKRRWRISEATLLTLAVIGGSIGAWTGMQIWHHKTMHKKFKYGVPLIIILQVALVACLHTFI